MANTTDPFAQSVHGTNPQYLIEKITRLKIYNSVYWKEQCFGLTSETIMDKAVALKYCGGTYGGNLKPTNFLCLVLKLLQLQPEIEIVIEFIKNENFKYLRALGAFYLRLVGKVDMIYQYLEPLLNDYRKLSYRGMSGWISLHMDEFVDSLLRDELVCDMALPHLIKRMKLEEQNLLLPRKSALDDEIAAACETSSDESESDDEDKVEGEDDKALVVAEAPSETVTAQSGEQLAYAPRQSRWGAVERNSDEQGCDPRAEDSSKDRCTGDSRSGGDRRGDNRDSRDSRDRQSRSPHHSDRRRRDDSRDRRRSRSPDRKNRGRDNDRDNDRGRDRGSHRHSSKRRRSSGRSRSPSSASYSDSDDDRRRGRGGRGSYRRRDDSRGRRDRRDRSSSELGRRGRDSSRDRNRERDRDVDRDRDRRRRCSPSRSRTPPRRSDDRDRDRDRRDDRDRDGQGDRDSKRAKVSRTEEDLEVPATATTDAGTAVDGAAAATKSKEKAALERRFDKMFGKGKAQGSGSAGGGGSTSTGKYHAAGTGASSSAGASRGVGAGGGGKEVVNAKGEKVVITASEGTVEYWNQMREALGLKKLK